MGGVGAILAVPLTLLIIAVLDSNDNTRVLANIMRLSSSKEDGDQTKDREKLAKHWDGFKSSLRGDDTDS